MPRWSSIGGLLGIPFGTNGAPGGDQDLGERHSRVSHSSAVDVMIAPLQTLSVPELPAGRGNPHPQGTLVDELAAFRASRRTSGTRVSPVVGTLFERVDEGQGPGRASEPAQIPARVLAVQSDGRMPAPLPKAPPPMVQDVVPGVGGVTSRSSDTISSIDHRGADPGLYLLPGAQQVGTVGQQPALRLPSPFVRTGAGSPVRGPDGSGAGAGTAGVDHHSSHPGITATVGLDGSRGSLRPAREGGRASVVNATPQSPGHEGSATPGRRAARQSTATEQASPGAASTSFQSVEVHGADDLVESESARVIREQDLRIRDLMRQLAEASVRRSSQASRASGRTGSTTSAVLREELTQERANHARLMVEQEERYRRMMADCESRMRHGVMRLEHIMRLREEGAGPAGIPASGPTGEVSAARIASAAPSGARSLDPTLVARGGSQSRVRSFVWTATVTYRVSLLPDPFGWDGVRRTRW